MTTVRFQGVTERKRVGFMAGKFELYTDETGMHRFRLKASNGSIVVTGDPHESRDDCIRSIESIRKLAPYAELKEAAAG